MIYRIIAPSVCLALLAGCQVFQGSSQHSAAVASEDVDMSSYFAQLMAQGRRHLQANRPAAAVTAFRQASYGLEYRAEAFNGMAVAYDLLGRADLAERYFTAALRLEPDSERYSSNLVLFEVRRSQNMNLEQFLAEAEAQADSLFPAAVADDTAAPPAQAGRLQRISSNEVHLSAVSAIDDDIGGGSSLPTQADRPSRPATIHVARNDRPYPVRIELAPPAEEASSSRPASIQVTRSDGTYPIRFALDSVTATQVAVEDTEDTAVAAERPNRRIYRARFGWTPAARRHKGYPVRISIRSADS